MLVPSDISLKEIMSKMEHEMVVPTVGHIPMSYFHVSPTTKRDSWVKNVQEAFELEVWEEFCLEATATISIS